MAACLCGFLGNPSSCASCSQTTSRKVYSSSWTPNAHNTCYRQGIKHQHAFFTLKSMSSRNFLRSVVTGPSHHLYVVFLHFFLLLGFRLISSIQDSLHTHFEVTGLNFSPRLAKNRIILKAFIIIVSPPLLLFNVFLRKEGEMPTNTAMFLFKGWTYLDSSLSLISNTKYVLKSCQFYLQNYSELHFSPPPPPLLYFIWTTALPSN